MNPYMIDCSTSTNPIYINLAEEFNSLIEDADFSEYLICLSDVSGYPVWYLEEELEEYEKELPDNFEDWFDMWQYFAGVAIENDFSYSPKDLPEWSN